MILGYEWMVFRLNHSDILGIRNGADVLFRQFFAMFNVYGFYMVGFVVTATLIISYYFHKKEHPGKGLKSSYFALMLLESVAYAVLLFWILDRIGRFTLQSGTVLDRRTMIALALGAGVYEEFIFRVVLIGGAFFFLRNLLRFHSVSAIGGAILFSSILFSGFHYLGAQGDLFTWRSFVMRLVAGLMLAFLYVFRGYGIAAYTHTLYDFLIIML